ncbi:MAG TPA: histone deacetylase [Acidimicrobiales bacterium]|nr:histone deacetylase [Acidimicrobiales bacterium]
MLLVVSNAGADDHDTGPGHPERPSRTRVATDGLVEAGLHDAVVAEAAAPADRDDLVRVHLPAYVDGLERLCASGGGDLDPDTPTVRGSWATALSSAGAGLQAVQGLAEGRADAALVLTRPPGHHALPQRGMGFCLFNNIAVTAASLTARGERVLIVDWDVHHGNGTQAAFYDDPRVLFVSLHQRGLYPHSGFADEVGGPEAAGLTMNLPLPAGTTGDVLLAALDTTVAPVVDAFAPTWVLVSAGFDGHRADPLADFGLSAGDFADLATRVAQFAPAPGRLLLFLEGGYDLDALRASVGAAAAAVLGERYRPEGSTAGGPGMESLHLLRQRRAEALEAG